MVSPRKLVAVLVLLAGCSQPAPAPNSGHGEALLPTQGERSASGQAWAKLLGQKVTLEGHACDMKVGALLVCDGDMGGIFIDGLSFWPDGYYSGGEKGRRVRVTGTVIQKADLPVFIPKPGEPVPQGIPMPEGTDLNEASKRYLLKGATWTLID
jgi:hypothetical protein